MDTVPPEGVPELARYRFEAPLGAGGMAVVWRAVDTMLKRPVAIKIIRGEGRAASVRTARLDREARLLARIESARFNEHIVRVYDRGTFVDPRDGASRSFIVMQLVEGGTADQALHEDGPVPARRAVTWMLEVLSALHAAHQVGVVHRDVKPANILIDGAGRAVLADFGIAIAFDDEDRFTRTGLMMGSAAYAAPEQRRSARQATAASDIYAAGATLYQLLTGDVPDHLFADGPEEPRWQRIPEPLRAVMVKATRKLPEDRYATADAFAAALARTLPVLPDGPIPLVLDMSMLVTGPTEDESRPGDWRPVAALPEAFGTLEERTLDDPQVGGRRSYALVAAVLAGAVGVGALVALTLVPAPPPAPVVARAPEPIAASAPAAEVPAVPASDAAPLTVPPEPSVAAPRPAGQKTRPAGSAAPAPEVEEVAPVAVVDPAHAPFVGRWKRFGGFGANLLELRTGADGTLGGTWTSRIGNDAPVRGALSATVDGSGHVRSAWTDEYGTDHAYELWRSGDSLIGVYERASDGTHADVVYVRVP